MELRRRRLLAATVCAVLVGRVRAAPPLLPTAVSLSDELHQAVATGGPSSFCVELDCLNS